MLGIINDLVTAIEDNNVSDINTLLQQLGRTPFLKKQKPTPYDEAASLIWYLENVFYQAIGNIASELRSTIEGAVRPERLDKNGPVVRRRPRRQPFRDERNHDASSRHSAAIIRSYHADVRRLKRRLTFCDC